MACQKSRSPISEELIAEGGFYAREEGNPQRLQRLFVEGASM
ncbi:hypothetical protein CFT9_19635 [Pseudomonas sp. CFT9]|nr:hypothetical protein CFT9_19635 [Pseudomonas sp. CFT9]